MKKTAFFLLLIITQVTIQTLSSASHPVAQPQPTTNKMLQFEQMLRAKQRAENRIKKEVYAQTDPDVIREFELKTDQIYSVPSEFKDYIKENPQFAIYLETATNFMFLALIEPFEAIENEYLIFMNRLRNEIRSLYAQHKISDTAYNKYLTLIHDPFIRATDHWLKTQGSPSAHHLNPQTFQNPLLAPVRTPAQSHYDHARSPSPHHLSSQSPQNPFRAPVRTQAQSSHDGDGAASAIPSQTSRPQTRQNRQRAQQPPVQDVSRLPQVEVVGNSKRLGCC